MGSAAAADSWNYGVFVGSPAPEKPEFVLSSSNGNKGFSDGNKEAMTNSKNKSKNAANRLQGSDGWVQTWELLFWIKRFNAIFVDLSLIFGFLKFRVKGLTLFLNIFFTEIGFNFRVLLRQPRLAEHLLQASTAHATGPWAAGHRCGAPPHLQRLFATGAPYVKHI